MGIITSMTQYDNYNYINSSGVIVPDTSTVYDQVTQDFKNALGQDLDVTPETLAGRLVQCMTDYRTNTLAINAQNANQINLRYATGRFLDAIGSFFGLTRQAATSTRVLATVTGISGTVIPAGSQASTTNETLFYAESDITISSGGTATGYFLSVDTGAVECQTNTLVNIVNDVIGWEAINNPVAAIIGREQESDDAFRIRIEGSRYSGISLMQAIKAKLANVPGVLSSWAYDNYEKTSIVYDTVTIDGNSIVVVVDGGNDNDIANALFQTMTGGTGYTAISGQSTTVTVKDGAYEVPYLVTFNRPTHVPFQVAITVKNVNYTGSDLEQDVKNAVIAWSEGLVTGVDGLKIGQSVSPFEISAAVSAQIAEIYVKDCKVGLTGQTPSVNEIDFTVAQVGQISEGNITVTVA